MGGRSDFLPRQTGIRIYSLRAQVKSSYSSRLRSWLRRATLTMATWLWTGSSWTISTARHSLRTPHPTQPPPLPLLQPSGTATSKRTFVTGVPWARSSSGLEVKDLRRTGLRDLPRTERAIKKVRLYCLSCFLFLSCDDSGYFVLAKGKNGEDKMRTSLVSLPISTHSDTCFSFWFQMLVRWQIRQNIFH